MRFGARVIATSVSDLEKASGLTQGSFFKAFKDKKSLYFEAVAYHREYLIDY
ncbi:MAG: hypothetical protein CMI18_01975 [Opitutaceae bacterium]|nr:hypothetical protein [Opitutaceae bacterium]